MYHFIQHICLLGWQTLFWGMLVVPIFAQQNRDIDTAAIYKQSTFVPRRIAKDPTSLAKHLTKNYTSENEKVLAISYWIAHNIKYNYKAFKRRTILQKNSIQVLQKRTALCGEYAQLFKEMCAAIGIQAAVVNGYTKGFDFFETDTLYRAEHAWSIVRINEKWQLMDLTYGSGHIESKKQPFSKLMTTLFGVNYIPKFKYVHAFDPQWFSMTPDELIFTHFPNLSMYQLLETPLPLKLFKQGGWLIHGHLSWYYKTLLYNPAIDAYLKQSQLQQWLQEGEEGHKNNPDNYRVKGINYYWVVDSLFRVNFDKEREQLTTSTATLQQLKNYTAIADSCLKLSLIGNERELYAKELQSLSWQQRLSKHNNYHIDCLEQQSQKNIKQEELVKQIERNNESSQHLVTQLIQQRREPMKKNTNSIEPQQVVTHWEKQRDSLQQIAALSIHQKDSFMKLVKENKDQLMILKENLVLKIYEGNSSALKKLFRQKKLVLPLVYETPQALDKDWLIKSYQRADSINGKVTHNFLVELRKNQLASYQKIKQYCKAVDDELKLVQKAKRYSHQNEKEKSSYLGIILDLEKHLTAYQKELKDCLGFQKKLVHLLTQEIKQMEQSTKTLEADIALERYRHVEYLKYRQFIRQAEDLRIQVVLQRLDRIQRYIENAEDN